MRRNCVLLAYRLHTPGKYIARFWRWSWCILWPERTCVPPYCALKPCLKQKAPPTAVGPPVSRLSPVRGVVTTQRRKLPLVLPPPLMTDSSRGRAPPGWKNAHRSPDFPCWNNGNNAKTSTWTWTFCLSDKCIVVRWACAWIGSRHYW